MIKMFKKNKDKDLHIVTVDIRDFQFNEYIENGSVEIFHKKHPNINLKTHYNNEEADWWTRERLTREFIGMYVSSKIKAKIEFTKNLKEYE